MAIQTLNTIKNWFKTGLKPSQAQFWDTWDSFRHKFEKVSVKDIEGIDELLLNKADKTVLDNHIADKNAHAPQVNTDWNSESGFSQLINKPEFKTINGEPIVGTGDITLDVEGLTFEQVLSNGSETTQTALFKSYTDSDVYTNTINAQNIEMTQSSTATSGDNKTASLTLNSELIDFVNSNTGETTALFAQGVEFGNLNSNHFSALGMNPATTASYSNVLMPVITEEGETKTLATLNDIPTFLPVSATQSGIVDNTPLQELGGTDKLIKNVRIGKGEGTITGSTVLGDTALSTNTTGTYNTAIGSSSLRYNTTGKNSVAVGAFSLRDNTIGERNVSVGMQALSKNTIGNSNIGIGYLAGYNTIDGSANIFLGTVSGQKNTSGSNNTAIGGTSLYNNTTGKENTFVGSYSGSRTTTGEGNVGIGINALGNGFDINNPMTGGHNVALGSNAGWNVTTGNLNILIGDNVAQNITTGSNNTVIGGVGGLNANDSNLAIFANGVGHIAIRKEADNRLLAPTLTNALIDSGGAKSLVTKEYLDAHSEGGSQNLDEILDNGNIATGKFIRLNEDANLQTNSVDIKFDKTVYRDKQQGTPSTEYDKNSITKFDVVLQDVISDFDFSVGVGNFKLPVKTKGSDYTLATTDDITGGSQNLQQTIDNGGIAIVGNQVEGNKISYVAITDENIILNNYIVDLDISSGITMGNGTGLKLGYSKPSLGFTTIVEFEEPTKGNSLLFPNKSGTLSTTEDFKTINGQSIVGSGDISVYDDNVLHKTGNESKQGDLNITGNLGITGNIELTDMDTFPRPPETNIILNKNGDLTATNFIGRSITSFTGQFHSNVTIGTAGYNGSKLEVNGTISTNGINVAAALTESSDVIFNSTPVGSQRTIAGNTIQIAGATGDYFLETFRYNTSDYGMQRITFTSTASAGRFFIRTVAAGVWSAWIEKQ